MNDFELRQASSHWGSYKSKALYISACALSLSFLLTPPTMLSLQLLSYFLTLGYYLNIFIMCLMLSHLTALSHCLWYDLLSLLMFS